MSFKPRWTEEAEGKFRELQAAATASLLNRQKNRKAKATKVEECVRLLLENPKHPGLNTRTTENPRCSKLTCRIERLAPIEFSGAMARRKAKSH
jgi:hypothetical protein